MKKILFLAIAVGLLLPIAAEAKDMTGRFGLGFVLSDTPVGGRYWINERVGLEAQVGYSRDEMEVSPGQKESASSFSFLVGVPISVMPDLSERANFIVHPAFRYSSMSPAGGGDSDSQMNIFALLEFEVFIIDNFSVSAAHGLGFTIDSPAVGESTTDFGTVGRNATEFGFHFYFGGGAE
jgi:hypothetical protein